MKFIMRHHQTIFSQHEHQLCKLLSNTPQPQLLPLEMAEAVLFNLATTVLQSLATEMAKPGGSFTSQKIQLLCCARDELQSLEGTVQTIQAVLLDAEKQQWHNNQVKLWLKRLKDVLYDVQDLLDDVATKDLRRKVTFGNKMLKAVRIFFSESNQLPHHLKVASKIQELRKKLDRIQYDNKFKFELHPREKIMAIGRGKKPEFRSPDTEIIGREKDTKKIIELLFDSSSSQRVSVVSIVGKGGLGKTALARLVYNDRDVKGHFGVKMWVCVSDVFDVNLIIKEILKSAKDDCRGHDDAMEKSLQDLENKPIDQLQRLLHETLDRKKYMLVLDDMWNEVRLKWLELGDWLKGGIQGSKILVTTRSHTVAKVTDEKSAIYYLEGLSRDKSWDLFREVTFGDKQALVEQRLEEMGGAIVRKCAGVPLAIRTIGSLLYGKKEDQWNRYKVKELPDIPEIDAVDNGIMQVLKFSYDHLPSCLKHCFAYCSLFPKDYVYDKEMMIHLWVAQGFIESLNGEDNLEEVAGNYYLDLQYRSFLDATTSGDNGEVLTFKMHDLMHDLAQKVAGDECKIFNSKGGGIDERIRHASFISEISSKEKMVSLPKTSKLRTFLYLEGDRLEKEPSIFDCHKFFSGYRHCRVLGLGKTNIPLSPCSFGMLKQLRFLDVSANQSIHSLPDSITDLVNLQTFKLSSCEALTTLPRDWRKLVNLRFLDVSENQSIQSLPDSITDLVNLQTLKLSGCEKLTTLPRDLKKLVNLRHLLIDGCNLLSHMPCGLNHLFSLQTLSQFVVQKMDLEVLGSVGSLDELGGLNRLAGSITLRNLEFLQPTPNKGHLQEKQSLRCLVLWWSTEKEDGKSESDELILWENLTPHPNLTNLAIYSCMRRSPPSWLSSITNLVELTLEECRKWKYLPALGELPSLRRLTLTDLDMLEFVQETSDPEQSNVACPFFPSLEKLNLLSCRNLKGWWGRRQLMETDQEHGRYDSHSSFPKLLYMTIMYCPHLDSMPLFPRIEALVLNSVSMRWWQQWMTVPNYLSEAAVSTFIPLSKLERLDFDAVVDLEDSILETLFPFLKNLKSLYFCSCDKLRSLSHGMQFLSSLQRLVIDDCEELDLSSHHDEHGTQWHSLTELCYFSITKLSKLVMLSEGIQHITTLEFFGL
ncbi:hypothetical protein BT93_H1340 [Corymbia citriodora subsp. variegata]|nr:hypothetical protein BT93_H1340 [Corymbia citriodora subsp. variegata]